MQEAHGFRHTFINWPYRYSHLRKFEYNLHGKAEKFGGLDNYAISNRMRFLHPVSLLSFGPRSLPPDFSLEAADCLSLYRAFLEARDALDFDVNTLDPIRQLPSNVLLKQKDILQYEGVLKERLVSIISASDAQDDTSPLNQVVRLVQDPVLAAIPSDAKGMPASSSAITSHLPILVADLYQGGDLVSWYVSFQ